MSTPTEHYRQALASGEFLPDTAQAAAVAVLQRVFDELMIKPPKVGLRERLLGKSAESWPPVEGAYLWGGVGRGKTWLMDAFYDGLPFSRKRRTHFHRFMRDVHARRALHADTADPLVPVADSLAREARVLCFDEFFVSDIADAMILGRLTEALFDRGVTLVATSNCSPDMLYRDGLQRARFVPAIERIREHCTVLPVDGGQDYRMRSLGADALYRQLGGADAEQALRAALKQIDPAKAEFDTEVEVNDRSIPARAVGESAAWFDFSALCEGPRGADDYIELSRLFQWVLLSEVPQLTSDSENEARRFITLVDECYDRNVKLMITAQVGLGELYAGKRLEFEFERTYSRLTEMQSDAYLETPHLG